MQQRETRQMGSIGHYLKVELDVEGERANGYLETSFVPGRAFTDIDDFNHRLTVWLRRANQRNLGTTKIRPGKSMSTGAEAGGRSSLLHMTTSMPTSPSAAMDGGSDRRMRYLAI